MTPRTDLGRKLLEIRERAIEHGMPLLTLDQMEAMDSIERWIDESKNAWKLEAERLAELVEAQRQVIATLREEIVRLNICIDSLI